MRVVIVGIVVIAGLIGCGGGKVNVPSNEIVVNAFVRPESIEQEVLVRFWFSAAAGKTYFIQVRDQGGDSNTYLKEGDYKVSESNWDQMDYHSDSVIQIEPRKSARWYIAVKDNNNVDGTSFTIRIATNDETISPPADLVHLEINGPIVIGSIKQKELARFYFDGRVGFRYFIQARDIAGNSNVYLSRDNPLVDSSLWDNRDNDSDDTIEFLPSRTGRCYLSVEDDNNFGGTDFTIRAATEDDNLAPLPDSAQLVADGSVIHGTVAINGISRYFFSALAGTRYLLHVRDTAGNTNTYLSASNPLTDGSNRDQVDYNSDDDLYFIAQRTARVYLSIIDQNNAAGSTFAISILRS